MPALIPVIASAAAAAAGATAIVKAFIVVAATVLSSAYQARRARKRANAALRASLQDRLINFPALNAPRKFIYGADVQVGVDIYPIGTSGTDGEFFHLVGLIAAREITAIKRIFIGDHELLFNPATGDANAGRFFKSFAVQKKETLTTNASGSVTLAEVPITGTVSAVQGVGLDQNIVLGFSVSAGGVVTGAPASTELIFTYSVLSGTPLVNVRRYLGTTAQAADPVLQAAFGASWPATSQLKSLAYVALRIAYDPDVFGGGVESIRVIVDGHQIFDPRTAGNVLSTNPALCCRDLFTHPLLGNKPAADCDDATVIAAANACDEQILIKTGPDVFQKRYECGGSFTSDENVHDLIGSIADSMAGWANFQQGKLVVKAGVWSTPVLALNEDDILAQGTIALSTSVPRQQLFNGVTGTFQDPVRNHQAMAFSPYKNATYATQDGGEILFDVGELRWTRDNIACQRLAKVFLERARQAISGQMAFNFRADKLTAGDTFTLTWADQGWSAKTFRAVETEFNSQSGVSITFVEDAPGVYNWNLGEQTSYDLAPNTTLPDPLIVPAPTGLTLSSGDAAMVALGDGTIVERMRIQWAASTDPDVINGGRVQIEYRRADAPVTAQQPFAQMAPDAQGSASAVYVDQVQDGIVYYARIRFVTGNLGVASPWTYSAPHKVIGKSAPPPAPVSITVTTLADGTRRYTPTQPALPVDFKECQLRYGTSGQTWANMQTLGVISRDQTFLTTPTPLAAGTYDIRAINYDGSGNASAELLFAGVVLGAAVGTVSLQPTSATEVVSTEIADGSSTVGAISSGSQITDRVTIGTITWSNTTGAAQTATVSYASQASTGASASPPALTWRAEIAVTGGASKTTFIQLPANQSETTFSGKNVFSVPAGQSVTINLIRQAVATNSTAITVNYKGIGLSIEAIKR